MISELEHKPMFLMILLNKQKECFLAHTLRNTATTNWWLYEAMMYSAGFTFISTSTELRY
jgi:hypothetical protein